MNRRSFLRALIAAPLAAPAAVIVGVDVTRAGVSIGDDRRHIDLKGIYSPFLVRANIRARDKIVEQMADDFRTIVTRRGSVDTEDLELLGWTMAQINTCGADARRRAIALEVRVAA